MCFVQRLAKHWSLEGVFPDTCETADAIAAFEDRFTLTLPPDVRAFFERFNGLLDMDGDLNRFWPIGEIDTVPAIVEPYSGTPDYSGIGNCLPDSDRYFAFADHSIWVCVYAMRLSGNPDSDATIVWIADGTTFDILADTFKEFWDLYLTSPDRILVPYCKNANEPSRAPKYGLRGFTN